MKVCFTIADLQPENGGPSRSVSALAGAVAKLGVQVELLALEYGAGKAAALLPDKLVNTTLVPCRGALAQKLKWSPQFKRAVEQGIGKGKAEGEGLKPEVGVEGGGQGAVVLHDNGLWLPTNRAAAKLARARQVPFIVSPRGMLTPWAFRFRGFKKRIAWAVYQRRDLQSARVLHATSEQEATELRALGLTRPIAVIPNGVKLPPDTQKPEIRNEKLEKRTVLFLSRLHPIKGLLDLVTAWAQLKSEIKNQKSEISKWRVVVVGGDENGHLREAQTETGKLKVENDFEFVGEVADEQKWDWYRRADLFVLPTKSENFGIAIAEALACGVPVITTHATPWHELVTQACGWWIEPRPEALADALQAAMRLSDAERQAMGLRGRKLIEQNYTWEVAAKKMKAVYEWALNLGNQPAWVQ